MISEISQTQKDTICMICLLSEGFPGGSVVKNTPAKQETSFDPWVGRSPGKGNDIPLQHSCLGNPKDRGAWWATVHGIANSWTRLSN